LNTTRWSIYRWISWLEIGWADLRKNQAHFNEVAKELEPDKQPSAVVEELGQNHPARIICSMHSGLPSMGW